MSSLCAVLCATGGGVSAAADDAGLVPQRSEIDALYTWDLTDLYADQAAWQKDLDKCATQVEQLADMKGVVTQGPAQLAQYLTTRDELYLHLERAYIYAMLLHDQDQAAPGPQAMQQQAYNLWVRLSEATSWFEPQILTLDEATLMGWIRNTPDLQVYEHEFENLMRQKEHVLSAREEELLAMTGKLAATPREAYSLLTNADIQWPTITNEDGEEVQVTEGRYMTFMQSSDRRVRRDAFNGLIGTYMDYKNTLATLLAGSIHSRVFNARARSYDSALHAALAPDNVPIEVYDNLIATVHEHLPKMHRYFKIRQKHFGIDEVYLYDSFVPVVREEPPGIKYDDAVKTITRALTPLGPEYLEPMTAGFASRWVDVYETRGKRSGAYSTGVYTVHPYILLNYDNTYHDMFTVAHEMGHAMHSWFTARNQPPAYGDYSIFVAEVASTCNEILLAEHLREQARQRGDRSEQLFLINLAIEGIRGTVIRQTMWAEYEKLLHAAAERGEPLTYEAMSTIYHGLSAQYYGPVFGHDDIADAYWLRVPHFYRGFYVYKYATSYCASAALAQRVLADDPDKLDAYLGFLKAGSSDYPIEILRKAGVDMRTPAPIHATMEMFGKLLDELEQLLGEA